MYVGPQIHLKYYLRLQARRNFIKGKEGESFNEHSK